MAGLKKPASCSCGNAELHREWHPERWICDNCGNVIISRGKRPTTGVCRVCGRKHGDVPFHKHGNICVDCRRNYNKQYGKDNREKLCKQKRQYYADNQPRLRKQMNAHIQSNPETFVSNLVRRCRTLANRKMDGKTKRDLSFDLDKTFLIELWYKQNGLCAISGVPMDHKWDMVTSCSVDRIDSSKGYIRDNVQLVCKGINLMKNKGTNEDVQEFLDAYFQSRLSLEISSNNASGNVSQRLRYAYLLKVANKLNQFDPVVRICEKIPCLLIRDCIVALDCQHFLCSCGVDINGCSDLAKLDDKEMRYAVDVAMDGSKIPLADPDGIRKVVSFVTDALVD